MSEGQEQTGPTHVATPALFALWREPLVFVLYLGMATREGILVALAIARGAPCHFLALPNWRMDGRIAEAQEIDAWLRSEHPNTTFTVLGASEADAALVRLVGINAFCASHQAFVDERIFYPEPDLPKLYDAVHNANTSGFKRHALAQSVNNVALITYAIGGKSETFAPVIEGYRSLGYVNYSAEKGHRYLDAPATRRIVNQSRCGVMVSGVEGANNASMEYLLCGVPLVTTPSEGGREEMYPSIGVAIVEPDPESVARAVAAYQTTRPDPFAIRAATLARARPHRARLIAWLSERVGRDLTPLADSNLWLPQFRDKLVGYFRIERRADGTFDARAF